MYPTASVPHAQPIRFAGSVLNANRHVCGFFRTPEEEYGLLLPFIKEGIDRGEKTINVVAPANREDHLRRLSSCGIDVTATAQSGQLEVHSWEELYFPDGCFDQERMLAMWQDVLAAAGLKGYARTRLVAHMEWALEEREGVSDLLEYEARCDAWFNTVPQNERHPIICAYDLTKFSGTSSSTCCALIRWSSSAVCSRRILSTFRHINSCRSCAYAARGRGRRSRQPLTEGELHDRCHCQN
ncbi:MAG: MEDS domain-containing protein [Burkholderiales bacterium]